MKDLRRFFDYLKPHETLEGLRRSLFLSVVISFVLFALVGPVSTTVVCGSLLLLSGTVNFFNFKMPLTASYLIGAMMLFALRSSLAGGAYSQEFFASLFMVLALCQSCKLTKYAHGQLLLIWLLAANAVATLLDASATLSVWVFLVMFLNLGQMLRLHLKNFSLATLANSLRSALRTSAYALPMLLIFIYVFQRSYEHRHTGSENSVMGISRTLEPGKVSKLSSRSGTAYRVSLDRTLPPLLDTYWRVATLTKSKGLSWRGGGHETGFLPLAEAKISSACKVQQKVFGQEYDTRSSVLSLDRPVEGTLVRDNPTIVTASICGDVNEGILTAAEMKDETFIEGAPTSEVKNLVATLKKGKTSAEEIAGGILSYFKKEGFKYSLEAGASGGDDFGYFLFKSKVGYCEHFAAATASLLRMAGVPARVVVGFQGGTYNPYGNYWLISYQDAHAWVEMWNGHGWRRLDPVATIAPNELRGSKRSKSFLSQVGTMPGFETLWLGMDDILFKAQQIFSGHDKILELNDLTMDPFLALGSLVLLFLILQIKKSLQPLEKTLKDQFLNLCEFLAGQGLRRGRSEGYESYRLRVTAWLERDARLQSCILPFNELFFSYENFRFGAKRLGPNEVKKLINLAKFCKKKIKKQFRFSLKTLGYSTKVNLGP